MCDGISWVFVLSGFCRFSFHDIFSRWWERDFESDGSGNSLQWSLNCRILRAVLEQWWSVAGWCSSVVEQLWSVAGWCFYLVEQLWSVAGWCSSVVEQLWSVAGWCFYLVEQLWSVAGWCSSVVEPVAGWYSSLPWLMTASEFFSVLHYTYNGAVIGSIPNLWHCRVANLGKLFPHSCICYQAKRTVVLQNTVLPYCRVVDCSELTTYTHESRCSKAFIHIWV